MQQRGSASDDWQFIETLRREGYGHEDIVVILRQHAYAGGLTPTWTPERVRAYVLSSSLRSKK